MDNQRIINLHKRWNRLVAPIANRRKRASLVAELKPSGPHFVNWWKQRPEENWLLQFCLHHKIDNVIFGSVFGNRAVVETRFNSKHRHIFFTPENLSDRFTEYQDHLIHHWDAGLGFEHVSAPNYLRFPLWIQYLTNPKSVDAGQEVVEALNHKQHLDKQHFATLVASHDHRGNGRGLRTECYHHLQSIGPVLSGGGLLKNTDFLQDKFGNNANQFIGSSVFNIALENSNQKGYCTEKIFRPLRMNTIPIYWGDEMNPEPEVLNQDCFIPFEPTQPELMLKEVQKLKANDALRKAFLNQPKTTPQARDWINARVESLLALLVEG